MKEIQVAAPDENRVVHLKALNIFSILNSAQDSTPTTAVKNQEIFLLKMQKKHIFCQFGFGGFLDFITQCWSFLLENKLDLRCGYSLWLERSLHLCKGFSLGAFFLAEWFPFQHSFQLNFHCEHILHNVSEMCQPSEQAILSLVEIAAAKPAFTYSIPYGRDGL